jgi:hypothetical protein
MLKYKDPIEHKVIEKIEEKIKKDYNVSLQSLKKFLNKKLTQFSI